MPATTLTSINSRLSQRYARAPARRGRWQVCARRMPGRHHRRLPPHADRAPRQSSQKPGLPGRMLLPSANAAAIVADGGLVVAGHHRDVHAHAPRLCDGCSRLLPRRIVRRQQAEKLPWSGLAVPARDPKRAVASHRQGIDLVTHLATGRLGEMKAVVAAKARHRAPAKKRRHLRLRCGLVNLFLKRHPLLDA